MLPQISSVKYPLLSFYLQPYPAGRFDVECDTARYCPMRKLNITPEGFPLFAIRFRRPPTNCITPGHTIKAGFTRGGKWRASKYIPTKTDKRAGK